jgi:hypothetical protein
LILRSLPLNIVDASKEDSRSRLLRRALAFAIPPVIVVVLVLMLGAVAVEMGWLKTQAGEVRLPADTKGPLASVGRGLLGKDGYLLEVPAGGNIAVAAWTELPSGLAELPLIRCDCVPRRVDAKLNMLWRRADHPDKTFSAPIEHELGETQLLDLSRNPDWTGEIIGIAVALSGYPGDVVLIRGVDAQKDTIGNRLTIEIGNWASFRKWDGQSINLAIIGARDRAISPVLLVAVAIGLGLLASSRLRPPRSVATLVIVSVVIIGWAGLDARWQLDLLAKYHATVEEFGRGPIEERRRRGPDGDIYELAASVKRGFRDPSQRVFVAGDEPYPRGRAAYHLLPLLVHYDAVSGALPSAQFIRPGDLIFLTWSRQVRYDEQAQRLIWNGGAVRVKPIGYVHGNVVFKVVA